MHRQELRDTLGHYRRTWGSGRPAYPGPLEHEKSTLEQFEEFLDSTPDCFQRSHPPGHLTGSALVWCPVSQRVLLTHHRKLGRWLQLGGHADGCPHLDQVALQEAREESGLQDFSFFPYERALEVPGPLPFDLDIHEIPQGPHLHYDVRYMLVTDSSRPLCISSESNDLRWVDLAEARSLCPEISMLRQFDKLAALQ